jgi:predicted permease
MIQDFKYGIRMLRRSPGFSLLAILCLTLGIGATTSVFSWIEGILLRPYPLVRNQDRMVALTGTDRNGRTGLSWPDFLDFQKNCTLFDALITDRIFGTTLAVGDRAERASGSIVSANYFQALGIRPVMGRFFERGDDVGRNSHPAAVISYQAWKDRYHGDPNIVGRTQFLNGVQHTIIGVAPEGFLGTFVGYSFQFWVPASMEEIFEAGGYKLENRGARWIEGYAVLKPGVTIEQAQAEISTIAARLDAQYPATNRNRGVRLFPLWQTPFNGAGTMLSTLRVSFFVSCLVLLIACANVANLLLVRSVAQRQETTIRLSIGAGRMRLLRQLLTEGLVLAALAAGGGVLVAHWARDLMVLMFPRLPGIVVSLPGEIDTRVLALSAAVCLIATVLFGLVPAMQAGRIDLAAAMKSDAAGVVGGRGRAWIRSGLVLLQVALSFVLLVGSALLLKSMQSMIAANPGFSTKNVLTTSVGLVSAGYDAQRIKAFHDRLLEQMESMGGVESAAFARVTPFTYQGYTSSPIAVDGFIAEPGEQPVVEYDEVGPRFLATMGIPLLAGREFTRADNESAAPVVIVNEAMALQYWPGQDPVGKRVQVKGRWLQVIGVAKNAKYRSLIEPAKPFMYIPLRQTSAAAQNLEIRTSLPAEALANALVREVKALDANLAPGEVITMQEQIYRMTWSQRAAGALLRIFTGTALLLAGIGLFGVMSYAVSQSTRELGLRLALGANGSDLLRIVMSRGLGLALAGIGIGAIAAFGLTRLMGDLLYQTSPRDPASFAWAMVVMTVAAIAACLLPALRASRTDPVKALRDS